MNNAAPHRTRKIDPTRGALLGDQTPNDMDRMEIGPTALAYAEWEAAGLTLPDLPQMRRDRLERLRQQVVKADLAGVLMFDPLNIRYATDSTNMQLWNMHNPFRACLVCADGYMVLWDYSKAPFLSSHNPLVAEVRSGASMFYFVVGDEGEAAARAFAGQVAEILKAHSGSNSRLAVDKIMQVGLEALIEVGLEVSDGEVITEHARSVKSPDEIRAMRCSIHACEASMAEMEEACQPGLSENEVWAVLHAANIRRGGEWIETRLLTSGPRTNPWFQESGPRVIQNNEIVAFDTDLVGCYGICTDMSRTWWIGDGRPTNEMISAMRHAHDHIMQNMEMLKPGVTIRELVFGGHQLEERYQKQKYSCKFHGVGLCDEWPMVDYPDTYVEGAWDYALEPGMTFCAEALVSAPGTGFSIKLEDQVLITEDGFENLSSYPFDARLMGEA